MLSIIVIPSVFVISDAMKLRQPGMSVQPEPVEAGLDLGELNQVLKDEELARKLQEEEEQLLRRVSDPRG